MYIWKWKGYVVWWWRGEEFGELSSYALFITSRARDCINSKWDCASVYHRKISSEVIIDGMVWYHFIGCRTMPRSYSIILFTHISPELVGSGNEPSYQCGWYETIQMATSAYHLHHPIFSTHSFHPISLYPFSQLSSFLVIVLSRETGMELARRVVLCLSREPSLSGYSPHFSNDQEL